VLKILSKAGAKAAFMFNLMFNDQCAGVVDLSWKSMSGLRQQRCRPTMWIGNSPETIETTMTVG